MGGPGAEERGGGEPPASPLDPAKPATEPDATRTGHASEPRLGAHWPSVDSAPAGAPPPPAAWQGLSPGARRRLSASRRRVSGARRRAGAAATRVGRGARDNLRTFQGMVIVLGLGLAAVTIVVRLAGPGGLDASDPLGPSSPTGDFVPGGTLVDVGTLTDGAPAHVDPARASTRGELQIASALYDGLTDVDPHDPAAVPRGVVAESWTARDHGLVWTFRIRAGLAFSDGTPVLPSSFRQGWDHAADPRTGSDDGGLFLHIRGGKEVVEGETPLMSGVVADDRAMTLEVTLVEPYDEFDALVAHPAFSPLPDAALRADPELWGAPNGALVGNGPFQLAPPTVDGGLDLVPNPHWDGRRYDDRLGLPSRPYLDRISFRAVTRPVADRMVAAGSAQLDRTGLGAGEVTPPGGAVNPTLTGGEPLAAAFLSFDWQDPVVGGPENLGLRTAVALAVDGDAIAQAVGAPRAQDGLAARLQGGCRLCLHDPDLARASLGTWQAAGHALPAPLRITVGDTPADAAVGTILVQNLESVGLAAEVQSLPPAEYRAAVAGGTCQVCWRTWTAEFPSLDALYGQVFGSRPGGTGNAGSYSSGRVDRLLREAHEPLGLDGRQQAYRSVEQAALDDSAVVPVLWPRAGYVHNGTVANLSIHPTGLVAWEQLAFSA